MQRFDEMPHSQTKPASEETLPKREPRERERKIRNYEYRNIEGRLIRAKVEVEAVDAAPEKEQYKDALLAQGVDKWWVGIYADSGFPHKEVDILRSFILTGEDGVEINVIADCNLEERKIYTGKGMHGGVPKDYNVMFIPEPDTALNVVVFLHENGHVEQEKDEQFMTWHKTLPADAPKRSESTPQEAALEFNANQRLVERTLQWKQMGVDITGFYPVDPEDPEVKMFLEVPGGEEVTEQIRASRTMSMEQMMRLQLLPHRLSERDF